MYNEINEVIIWQLQTKEMINMHILDILKRKFSKGLLIILNESNSIKQFSKWFYVTKKCHTVMYY